MTAAAGMRGRRRPIVNAIEVGIAVALLMSWLATRAVPSSKSIIEAHRAANAIACADSNFDLAATIEPALQRHCNFTAPAAPAATPVMLIAGTASLIALAGFWIGGLVGWFRGTLLRARTRLVLLIVTIANLALLVTARHRAGHAVELQTALGHDLHELCTKIVDRRAKLEADTAAACAQQGLPWNQCWQRYPAARQQYEALHKGIFDAVVAQAQVQAGTFSCAKPPRDTVDDVRFALTLGASEAVPATASVVPSDAGVPDAPPASAGAGAPPSTRPTAPGLEVPDDFGVPMAVCDAAHCLAPASCAGDICRPPPRTQTREIARGRLKLQELLLIAALGVPGSIAALLVAASSNDAVETEGQAAALVDTAALASRDPRNPNVAPILAQGARRLGPDSMRKAADLLAGTPAGATLERQLGCMAAIKAQPANERADLCGVPRLEDVVKRLAALGGSARGADGCAAIDYASETGRYLVSWVAMCACGGKAPFAASAPPGAAHCEDSP